MGTLRSTSSAPQPVQRTSQIDPWNSRMQELPADWWYPSTFWVTMTTWAVSSRSATAWWAALKDAAAMSPRRQSYQRQTSSGSRLKASGVASSSGRYRLHRLSCSPRKVGMPLAAEIPAPENTVIRVWGVKPSLIFSSSARVWESMLSLPVQSVIATSGS